MDLATILGIVLSIVAVLVGMVTKGAALSSLANPAAFMIIIVGTSAAVMNAFPFSSLKAFPKLMKMVFTESKNKMGTEQMIQLFTTWAGQVRKQGLLSLEGELKTIEDDFIRRTLKLAIDGMPAEGIREVAEEELHALEERHEKNAKIFTQAGAYAPPLGVLGAVIGLIAALGNLGDIDKLGHAIAGAFIATMLGIYVGYVLMNPFANKLKIKSAEEVKQKTLCLECILLIQAGSYPAIIENRILSMLSETERNKVAANKKSGAGDA